MSLSHPTSVVLGEKTDRYRKYAEEIVSSKILHVTLTKYIIKNIMQTLFMSKQNVHYPN